MKKNLIETSIFFNPKECPDISIEVLQSRFASVKTVPGIQKYHSLISSSRLILMLKKYSLYSSQYDVFFKEIKGNKKEQCAISILINQLLLLEARGYTRNTPNLT